MKRFFSLYILYISYLLILGQGCSAINGVDHVVSVPIPSLENVPNLSVDKVSSLTFTDAPEKIETVIPSPLLTSVDNNKNIYKKLGLRKSLKLKSVKKVPVELKLNPVKKDFEIQLEKPHTKAKPIVEVSKNIENIEKDSLVKNNEELSLRTGIKHYGFEHIPQTKVTSWQESLNIELERKLVALKKMDSMPRNVEALVQNSEEEKSDTVTNIQSSPEKKTNLYDPSDPEMLAMFEKPRVDINQILQNKEAQNEINKEASSEPVLIDYSNRANDTNTGLAQVAAAPISSAVSRVIRREMSPASNSKLNWAMLNKGSKSAQRPQQSQENENKNDSNNGLSLYAMEASLSKGFVGDVANFNFIPSYDTNETLEDYGDGVIKVDYSLQNATGILRGTLLKNYYIRTSFEIPLGSEYSKFEIPMITQESIVDYLDENNLEGYGGYYLADLGEYLEDVELEKGKTGYQNTYEHRLLLNENFKKVAEGKPYRYVLFIGVLPGNVTVRYLGINGQETSKITFIAPDELLYDFSQLERPLELTVQTKLKNTLGTKATSLNIEPANFINFLSGDKAKQITLGEYKLQTPWKIKGARSYFELAYLQDSIFVGIDGDKTLELPSREFIGETLQAFNMDGLNKECLLQINFNSKVRDFKVLGESARGPAVFDLAFLDEDGVFSAEISPISKKIFILGNEDGVFNIKVTYENGNEDYLRTYCSTSTYLLEQL